MERATLVKEQSPTWHLHCSPGMFCSLEGRSLTFLISINTKDKICALAIPLIFYYAKSPIVWLCHFMKGPYSIISLHKMICLLIS
jgi:hypothetical protein